MRHEAQRDLPMIEKVGITPADLTASALRDFNQKGQMFIIRSEIALIQLGIALISYSLLELVLMGLSAITQMESLIILSTCLAQVFIQTDCVK